MMLVVVYVLVNVLDEETNVDSTGHGDGYVVWTHVVLKVGLTGVEEDFDEETG